MRIIQFATTICLLTTYVAAGLFDNTDESDKVSFALYEPIQHDTLLGEKLKETFENYNQKDEPVYIAIYEEAIVGTLKIWPLEYSPSDQIVVHATFHWLSTDEDGEDDGLYNDEDAEEGRYRLTKYALADLKTREYKALLIIDTADDARYKQLGFQLFCPPDLVWMGIDICSPQNVIRCWVCRKRHVDAC